MTEETKNKTIVEILGEKYEVEGEIYTPIVKTSSYEERGGVYIMEGDYLLPYMEIGETQSLWSLGKWGRMRREYLMNHHHSVYSVMNLNGTLMGKMKELNQYCEELEDTMMKQMMEQRQITEELKARDQMAWVGEVNNIKASIEEYIIREIICV